MTALPQRAVPGQKPCVEREGAGMPSPTQAMSPGITLGATQMLPPIPWGLRGLTLPASTFAKNWLHDTSPQIYCSLYERCK